MKVKNNYIGRLISTLRKQQGLSIEALCKGLCRKGKLSKIERGELIPDKMLLDAILERLGTSMEYYGVLYSDSEYKSYQARNEIRRLLWEGNQREAAQRAKELEAMVGKPASTLWRQFFCQTAIYLKLIKGIPAGSLEKEVLAAIYLTLPDFPEALKNFKKLRYQNMELSLLALYGEVLWEKGRSEESLCLLEHLVRYAETRLSDPYERVKVYPGLMLLLAKKRLEKGKHIKSLYQETLQLLQKEHSLIGLKEWLLLKREAAGKGLDFFGRVEHEVLDLLFKWSKKGKNVPDMMFFPESFQGRGTLLSYHFFSLRKSRGYRQEEFVNLKKAASTISRMEQGHHVPRQKTYQFLMEQFDSEEERYEPFLRTEDLYLLQLRRQLAFALESKQFEEAEMLLERLENRLDKEEIINRQAILFYHTVLNRRFKRKEKEELLADLEEALYMTMPKGYAVEKWPLGQMENTIWNQIAIVKATTRERAEAITILKSLLQSYENNPVAKENNMDAYMLSLCNLANYLGDEGQHEEAIRYTEEETKYAVSFGKAYRLARSLYDRAWSREILQEEKNACLEELRQAFCLAVLINFQYGRKHIEKHCQECYQISLEEWIKE